MDKIVAKMAFFSVIYVWAIFCVLGYPSQSSPIFVLISNTMQGNRHSLDDVFQLWAVELTRHLLKQEGSSILFGVPSYHVLPNSCRHLCSEREFLECWEDSPPTK